MSALVIRNLPEGVHATLRRVGAERHKTQPITLLPLTCEHIITQLDQRLAHHGPFDDLLLAQAQFEQFLLLTRDGRLIGHPFAITAGAA